MTRIQGDDAQRDAALDAQRRDDMAQADRSRYLRAVSMRRKAQQGRKQWAS